MPTENAMRRETLIEQGLSVSGGSCPAGYEFIGWVCPEDQQYRCNGCDDDDDKLPSNCGQGVRHYRPTKEKEHKE